MNGGEGDGKPATPTTKSKMRSRRPKIKLPTLIKTPTERVSQAAPGNLSESGKMHFPDGRVVDLHADDLIELKQLGRGTYGYVTLNKHNQSDLEFAIKHIKQQDEPSERKAMMQDLEVNRKTKDCPYTVEFYGALFREGEVLICMEVMETSLYDYYISAHKTGLGMPQDMLGAVSFAVLSAIKFLREECQIMHRDVKPSNILLAERDEKVSIKICDFGIAGNLINSMAKTNIGCKPYMSPERIETQTEQQGYNVKSDIWSLGISLVELAEGKHPYAGASAFKLLHSVVKDPSPCLDQDDRYSESLADFVNNCLKKDPKERSHYTELLCHSFILLPRKEASLLSHYKNVKTRIKPS